MIVLSGAALLLPDRILSPGTLTIEDGRIVDIRPEAPSTSTSPAFAFHGHYIVPGFIDVHVHGVDGFDTLDGSSTIAEIAARLPRYGVTAFCPTTVACAPRDLRVVLDQVRDARENRIATSARVLPAHLESNFINPAYNGAQPSACLRTYGAGRAEREKEQEDFSADDILAEIARAAPDVGFVTLASEIDGGLDLVRLLTAQGHRVSLGHSGATYEQALEAVAAGAHHATHLFNRMPPLNHREPGLAGAVLQAEEVAAEIICDGVHVHPAIVRAAIASKRPSRVMAITDGTSVSGLPFGSRGRLGKRSIVVAAGSARLEDGTMAGSTLTMDQAFRMLTGQIGLPLVDAVTLCATTPARELGLTGHGMLVPDAIADIVVLDPNLVVVQTYIGGRLAYSRNTVPGGSV
jgi:N-acetylglucosamine-6-phosphate deacetylase